MNSRFPAPQVRCGLGDIGDDHRLANQGVFGNRGQNQLLLEGEDPRACRNEQNKIRRKRLASSRAAEIQLVFEQIVFVDTFSSFLEIMNLRHSMGLAYLITLTPKTTPMGR